MWADIFLVALSGGILALDRTAAFQIMISRPIITGPLIGLLLGQPRPGIVIGGFLELLWINRSPLGGHNPPNECLGAIIASAAVILAGPPPDRPVIVFGLLLALPLARLATFMEHQIRRVNGWLARRALTAVTGGQGHLVTRFNLAGLAVAYLGAAVFILIFAPILTLLLRHTFPLLPSPVIDALDFMYLILPLIGVAVALSNINLRNTSWVFGLTFLVTLGILIY